MLLLLTLTPGQTLHWTLSRTKRQERTSRAQGCPEWLGESCQHCPAMVGGEHRRYLGCSGFSPGTGSCSPDCCVQVLQRRWRRRVAPHQAPLLQSSAPWQPLWRWLGVQTSASTLGR